jgi:hypothetical protein
MTAAPLVGGFPAWPSSENCTVSEPSSVKWKVLSGLQLDATADDFGFARFESESSEHATDSAAAATRAISAVVRGT